jgi:hypothetical protein
MKKQTSGRGGAGSRISDIIQPGWGKSENFGILPDVHCRCPTILGTILATARFDGRTKVAMK